MFQSNLQDSQPWYIIYEGDPTAGDPPAGDPPAGDPPAGDPPAGDLPKTFTQEQLNAILAEDRRKNQTAVQKNLDELNTLKSRMNITAEERAQLEQQLSEVQKQLMTKEELAAIEQQKLKKQSSERIKELEEKVSTWEAKYTDETIVRAITDTASSDDAYSPEQIVAILRPNTRLIDEMDNEGVKTGRQQIRVNFEALDKENKPVVLDLTLKETMERMKEIPKYLNLFKSDAPGGIGKHTRPGIKGQSIAQIAQDQAAYMAARKDGTITL